MIRQVTQMDELAIQTERLGKSFGGQRVLDELDLEVARGHHLRAARAERGREDHGGPDPGHAAAPPTPGGPACAGYDVVAAAPSRSAG